jgi:hypothetical protein
MPSAEERKVMHLANIGNYLYDLIVVMKEINRNLEDLAKIAKELNEIEAGPSPAWAKKEGE